MVSDILEVFNAGGFLMWPLLLTSLSIWFLMAWWWWLLWHESGSLEPLAYAAAEAYRRGGREEGMQTVASKSGFFARALYRFFFASGKACSQADYDTLFLEVEARFTGHGQVLRVLVKIAPLLGLLGTVVGMVVAFDVLYAVGIADSRSLSGGISCALFTTQAGLLIALPGLYGHNWLRAWNQRVLIELQHARRALSVLVK